MESTTVAYLNYISKQTNLYVAPFVYICGLISNVLCFLMFLSLKRLRTNATSVYLLVASIGNVVLFNTSFLSRLVLPNFNLDPSSTSLVWCKLRQYLGHASSLTSLLCTSWAMIDQYLSTSSDARLRRLSTVKRAWCVVSLTFIGSFLHSTPLIIYNNISVSRTNVTSCSLSNNPDYRSYVAYFVTPFLLGVIPTVVTIFFAVLAYANVNYLHQQQMRTQIQHQLTRMISCQVFFVLFGMLAYTVQTVYTLVTATSPKSALQQAQENVALTVTGVLSYIGYAFNFYIYMIVSPSLRKQFKRQIKACLLSLICCHHLTMPTNQTAPTHHPGNTVESYLTPQRRT